MPVSVVVFNRNFMHNFNNSGSYFMTSVGFLEAREYYSYSYLYERGLLVKSVVNKHP